MALTLSVLILTLADAAVATAAEPAEISGKITKLPPVTPEGRTVQVVAIHLPDGAVVDADRADNGRYAVSVPKGFNALLTQVIPFGGAKSTSVLSAAVKTKSGEHLKLKLRAKKRKHRPGGGHRRREAAKAASAAKVVAEDGKVYPGESVALRQFTGATGAWSGLSNGLPDMLVTDLMDRPASCEYTQVERRRLDLILQEIALGQSGLVDPDTAVGPGHLIPVELWIEGTLSNQFDFPAPLRYEIRIVEAETGVVRTTLRGFFSENFFEEEQALARQLAAAICAGPQPTSDPPPAVGAPHCSGPISGTHTITSVGAAPLEIAWSGNVEFTLNNEFASPPYGMPEPGPYADYQSTSGSLHATLHWTTDDGCTWSGETDFAIGQPANYGGLYAQEGVAEPAYNLSLAPASDSIPFTKSGPGPSCNGTGQWPLNGYAYA